MRNKLSVVLSATALFFCVIMSSGIFAKDVLHSDNTFDVRRAPKFMIPDESFSKVQPSSDKGGATIQQLGRIPTVSPGNQAAQTTYDYQHNGTMGRQVARRGNMVHIDWMGQNDYIIPGHRRGYYQAFNTTTKTYTQALGGASMSGEDYSGYATIDCLNGPNDVAVGSCHVGLLGQTTILSATSFVDFVPGFASFTGYSATPPGTIKETIWPQVCVHYGSTSDKIYMLTHVGTTDNGQDMILYSKDLAGGAWTTGLNVGYCAVLSYTIVALDGTDNVDIVYSDDRNGLSQGAGSQTDLDVYYKESTDQGATWTPRTCISNYLKPDSLWRAYADLSALISTDGNLHVVWGARELQSAEIYYDNRCRLIHWSTDIPNARTIAEARYEGGDKCQPGAWNMYIAKMSISECDGKLYTLWTQFLDRQHVVSGIGTDCSAKGYANGELWLGVSSDNGLSWDLPNNLTNSHTPNCDSNLCESDHWSSMVKYGMVYAGTDTLDLVYVNDKDAGGIPQGEGTWCVNPIMHLRIPCREPISSPQVSLFPNNFLDPTHTLPGVQIDTAVTIINIGNAQLNWSAAVGYQTGTGWISLSPASGAVASGASNTQVMNVTLNSTHLTTPDPSGWDAKIVVTSDAPTSPDTIPVHLTIASAFFLPQYVTLNTTCKKLRVYNTGRDGNNTAGESLDIPGDCDSGSNPNGRMYLYDGSPIISWIKSGTDTVSYSTMWTQSFTEQKTWRPQGPIVTGSGSGYDSATWVMSTSDSLFGAKVICYAPTNGTDCFVIEKIDFYLWGSTPTKTNVNVGWVVDYDTPADASVQNAAGYDSARATVWQRGAETDNADETGGCPIIEKNRIGGSVLLSANQVGVDSLKTPRTAWAVTNTSAQQGSGFETGFLYRQMIKRGYGANMYKVLPPLPDTVIDLHSGMCFERIPSMTTAKNYTYVIALVTTNTGEADYLAQVDAAKAWANAHKLLSCCLKGGDANNDTKVNVGDAVYMINFVFKSGPAPVCKSQGDANNDGKLNVGDAVYLINYVFKSGPTPVCGSAQ